MTAWVPKIENSSVWSKENLALRVFSPLVFSHAFLSAQRVFALGTSGGIWDKDSAPSSTWTAE